MSRLTVLIADDSEIMRASVRQLLKEDCDVIGEVSDGAAIVEVAVQLAPDVIIMDISLPGISGIEAARRLREIGCDSAIVFLSVHRQRRIVREALSTPGSGYVAKCDARRELVDAVHTVAGGASFLSQSLATME
jgi:DNA-binding NarL/FixJ family response regulator